MPPLSRDWRVETYQDARAHLVPLPDGGLRLQIDSLADGEPWQIVLLNSHAPVRQGRGYILSFQARSDKPRTLSVALTRPVEPFANLGLWRTISLTNEWQWHRHEFEATGDEEEGRLYFAAGAHRAALEIKDIRLEERQWTLHVHPGSEARLIATPSADSLARVEIDALSNQAPWHVQLLQTGIPISAGENYAVRFRCRSSTSRTATCAVAESKEPWGTLGLYRQFEVGSNWTEQYFEFAATKDDPKGRCYFELGSSRADFELADFAILRTSLMLSFEPGNHAHLVAFPRIPGETRVVITRIANGPTGQIRLERPVPPLQAGRTYALSFQARADEERTFIATLLPAEGTEPHLGLREVVLLNTIWRKHQFRFRATQAGSARLVFELASSQVPFEISNCSFATADG